MNQPRLSPHPSALATAIGLALGGPAQAVGMNPLEQERSVYAFVIVPQCMGNASDSDSAPGFGPFDSTVEAERSCTLAHGFALASQQSEFGPTSVTASGAARSDAAAAMQNTIHAIADSFFTFTFEVTATTEFTASGMLSSGSSDDPIVVLSGANLRLTGPDNQVIFMHEAMPGPSGEAVSVIVEEAGVLDPGVYTLRAEAASVIDNTVPPARFGDASFELLFEASDSAAGCPADVSGDQLVDIDDLLMVILAWDQCAGDCPADVNGDGTVDVLDLLEVLLAWGPCG
jgi:hypothetical protein